MMFPSQMFVTDSRTFASKVFATWVAIGNPYTAELVSSAGYDCVVVDLQHGAVTWETLGTVIQAIDINRVPSLVRLATAEPADIMRALDLGAAGVVLPMISTPEQAYRAAQAMRYPPAGNRSFGKVRSYYSKPEQGESPAAKPQEPLCFAMIETAEGLDNLAAIAAVEGIDGLFVGPVDLGLALGLGVVLEVHEGLLEAIEDIVKVCDQYGKISASASLGADYTRALMDKGVQLLVEGSDLGFIRRGAAQAVQQFRASQDSQ